MIKVALGATHDHDAQRINDPINPTMNRAIIIPFPTTLAVAVVNR